MAETKKKAVETEEKVAKKAAPKKAPAKKVEAKEEVKEAPKAKKAAKVEGPHRGRKVPKAKKEVEKKQAPKAERKEAIAKARAVKCTPRKARLVIDLVRGKDVDEALALCNLSNHMVAVDVAKLIKSAASNATNNFGLDGDKLYVAEIWANDSLKMRRYLPRAKGSASGLVKRFTNLTVIVKERN